MHIVLGASGQVGNAIVAELQKNGQLVRAVIRNPGKADMFSHADVEVAIADLLDRKALKNALRGGRSVMVLTPDNIRSKDMFAETDSILKNCLEAILDAGIEKVIGLSSIGAQHQSGTGTLLLSHKLERSLERLPGRHTCIRPAYYYSNWMAYIEFVREQGILPSFFPRDLRIPMISPLDVASFISQKMMGDIGSKTITELTGPTSYSASDVASTFSDILGRNVEVKTIPRDQWKETFKQAGFSTNAAGNFTEMTEAVVNGKARPERAPQDLIRLPTTLQDYLRQAFQSS